MINEKIHHNIVQQDDVGVVGRLTNTLLQCYKSTAESFGKVMEKLDHLKRPVCRGSVLLKDQELT